jgi:signal transduction histidine kinase
LAESTKQVTTIWPPTGIALVAIFLLGYRYWPAILVGAFVANFLTQEPFSAAGFIAIGNTLEAVTGVYLLRRFAGFKGRLDSVNEVLGLVVLAAFASTLISATIGTTTLGAGHLIAWHNYPSVWLRWWLGDMMGDLILAPLLFIILGRKIYRCISERPVEALLLFIVSVAASVFIFISPNSNSSPGFPLPYLTFPLIIWAAIRFTEVGAVTATLIITSTATLATLHNRGPFIYRRSIEQDLIFLYLFIGVTAVTAMLLAAVVAERKKTEQALIDQTKDLVEARRRVLHSAAKQREAGRQQDQLVSMASHELKTPLTSTKLFVEILQRHLKQTPGSKQATEYVSRVSQGLDRLTKLTGDLIDVNRTKTGKLALDKKPVDIDELIEKAVTDIQLTTKKVTLRVGGRTGQTIPVDDVRIRQVLVNLLNNAIRHAPAGSEIIISSLVKKPNLVIKVQNFGDGIPKKEQAKIFEPFYQSGNKRSHGQLGLGLHISHQIIDLHHGKIWVESQNKKGATFAFSLPISGKT